MAVILTHMPIDILFYLMWSILHKKNMNAKFLPKPQGPMDTSALISVSIALSQTTTEAASPQCVAWSASLAPSLRRYQFILLAKQRHMCVNNLLRALEVRFSRWGAMYTLPLSESLRKAERPGLEPATYWLQVDAPLDYTKSMKEWEKNKKWS